MWRDFSRFLKIKFNANGFRGQYYETTSTFNNLRFKTRSTGGIFFYEHTEFKLIWDIFETVGEASMKDVSMSHGLCIVDYTGKVV